MQVSRSVISMEDVVQLVQVQLRNGGIAQLNVTGYSMMPLLYHRRDRVQLAPATGDEKVGDVIFYRRDNGRYILHRIIQVTQDGYICCGDNQAEKEKVARQQLIAVMTAFTRNGKVYDISGWGYRLYTALWVKLFWLRPAYISLRRRLGCLMHKPR